VISLVVSGGSLARGPQCLLGYLLAEAAWQINEQTAIGYCLFDLIAYLS